LWTVCVLLGAAPLHAALDVATVVVRVAGPDTAVRLASGDTPERTRDVASRRGLAVFTAVPPGRHVVTAGACALPFEIAPGEIVRVRVAVAPDAGCAVADRDRAAFGTVFQEQDLRDLPSSGNAWSLLEVADPSAVLDRMDTGGLATAEPGRLGIRGSSWTQASLRLGDVDITDPLETGTPLVFPDPALLSALGSFSAALPVEAGTPGPTLAYVPRRPGARWAGAIQGQAGGAGREASAPDPPSLARLGSWRSGQALVSGPLVRDHLGLALGVSWARARRFERDDPAEREAGVASLFAQAVWTPNPRDEIRTLVIVQDLERPQQDDRRLHVQAAWERRREGGGTAWAVGGYQRATFEAPLALGSGRPVERLRDGPVPELVSSPSGTRDRWDMGAGLHLAPRRFAGAWHLPRLGATAIGVRSTVDPGDGPAAIAETVNGLPARVWTYGYPGPRAHWFAFDGVGYAADRMLLGDRASLEVGVRLEATRGAAREAGRPVSWTAASPRVSARVRLTERGGLALIGAYGMYRHRLPLRHLAFGDPAGPQGLVHRWSDANRDGLFQPAERGVLIARVGPGSAEAGVASIEPGLKAPRTREVVAGIEARLGDAAILRFTGFDRSESDLVESVNVGVPAGSYTVSSIPDPGGDILGPGDDQLLPLYDRNPASFGLDRYVLTNPSGLTGHHEGLEFTLEGTVAGRVRYRVGASASRTEASNGNRGFHVRENDQGVVGELLDQPNADTQSAGRTFFDRAYTIKISSSYRAPGDVRLGVAARYQDGQPFARLVIAPNLAQGPEAVQAVFNSRHRFTFTFTLDARVEKGVRVGRGRIAAIAEAFNVLDNRLEVEEDVVDGPGFRTVTAVQPPRALRFGLRYEF
jgi:hypothetical protein